MRTLVPERACIPSKKDCSVERASDESVELSYSKWMLAGASGGVTFCAASVLAEAGGGGAGAGAACAAGCCCAAGGAGGGA